MALNNRVALLPCLVFMLSLTIFFPSSMWECQYQIFVKTGDQPDAGTNSTISLTIGNPTRRITFPDLRNWGIMGSHHVYFQPAAFDAFQATLQICTLVCDITITSDGKGDNPAWYVERVVVTVSGTPITPYTVEFPVNQWLDSSEGHKLYTTVNLCAQRKPVLSSIV